MLNIQEVCFAEARLCFMPVVVLYKAAAFKWLRKRKLCHVYDKYRKFYKSLHICLLSIKIISRNHMILTFYIFYLKSLNFSVNIKEKQTNKNLSTFNFNKRLI